MLEIPVLMVVPPRVLLLDVAGPMEVLRKANLEQDRIRFTVRYVAPTPTAGSSIGLGIAALSPLPDDIAQGTFVVVSGSADEPMGGPPVDRQADAVHEAAIVAWLRRAVVPGVRLVSICSGAMLAGRAGLLDGYSCTTHHAALAELQVVAPLANVKENRLFVEDGERFTSAGITAGIDLMLHIVAQTAGHDTALAVARYLVIYLRRGANDPQLSPWLEGRNHLHPAIHRAQDAVAADPAAEWSVAALASIAAASPRNLSRLFNEHTGMSITDYVNNMRIALAHELVCGSRLDIEAIAERSGFASARQFRRAWNRLYDSPPSQMRSAG